MGVMSAIGEGARCYNYERAWVGGCYNGGEYGIKRLGDKMYTATECAALCASASECEAFSIGTGNNKRCVTFRAGCTPLTGTDWQTSEVFIMKDCHPLTDCPLKTPFAYYNGDYCCSESREKVTDYQGDKCDGSAIGYDSLCCSGSNVRCPSPPCKNNQDGILKQQEKRIEQFGDAILRIENKLDAHSHKHYCMLEYRLRKGDKTTLQNSLLFDFQNDRQIVNSKMVTLRQNSHQDSNHRYEFGYLEEWNNVRVAAVGITSMQFKDFKVICDQFKTADFLETTECSSIQFEDSMSAENKCAANPKTAHLH